MRTVPKRIALSVINSLKGGVVPSVGIEYITVGRAKEIEALLGDIGLIADGGSAFRFIVGKYGSGKSFLMQAAGNQALERGFVCARADLSNDRRLSGSKGQGLATYKELLRNLSTKTKPEGGALSLILEKWLSQIKTEAAQNADIESAEFDSLVRGKIRAVTEEVEGMVNGFEFSKALLAYYNANECGDEETKINVLRWFRGEFPTKTEAKRALGINLIVTDETYYDFLKLLAAFLLKAGYSGLIVMIDELVNIFKIPNSASRQSNYEKILTIYNDVMQGRAGHIGFLMGATPQCIDDTRRGVFSYEALRSRLREGRFSSSERRDMLSPIIRLEPLSAEEMFVLCEKLVGLHSICYGYAPKLDEQMLAEFIKTEYSRVGASELITPREIIRDFIELLNILSQNKDLSVREILGKELLDYSKADAADDDDEFADFEI